MVALKRSRFIIGLNPYFHGTPYAQCTRGVRQFWVGRRRAWQSLNELLAIIAVAAVAGPVLSCILSPRLGSRALYNPLALYTTGRHVLLLCKLLSLGHVRSTWKLWNSTSEFRDAERLHINPIRYRRVSRFFQSQSSRDPSKNRSKHSQLSPKCVSTNKEHLLVSFIPHFRILSLSFYR